MRKSKGTIGLLLAILQLSLIGLFFMPIFGFELLDEEFWANGKDMIFGYYLNEVRITKVHIGAAMLILIPIAMLIIRFLNIKLKKKQFILSFLSVSEVAGWIIARKVMFHVDQTKWTGMTRILLEIAAEYADEIVMVKGYVVLLSVAVLNMILTLIYAIMALISERKKDIL